MNRPAARGLTPGAGPGASEQRFVALLRGINVGGNNIIRMADLRARFQDLGFTRVETYVQSGNAVFSARPLARGKLCALIEDALREAFRYDARVILVSAGELERVIAQAPGGFGRDAERYHYDVLFVRDPLTTTEAREQVSANPGVDAVHAGDHALYYRRLISRATQSHLSRLVQRPAYKSITIRNWRTTTRLREMVLAPSSAAPTS